jgi:hypothetical protein
MTDLPNIDLVKALTKRIVAYNPIFRDITGSTTGALLLSQFCWHSDINDHQPFCLTDQQIIDETHMGEFELRNAKKYVAKFVVITKRGVPAKCWYAVDFKAIAAAISSFVVSTKLKPMKPRNCDRGNHETIKRDLSERSKINIEDKKYKDRTGSDRLAFSSNEYPPDYEKLWALNLTVCKKGSKPRAFKTMKAQLKKHKGLTVDILYAKLSAQLDERAFKVKCGMWVGDRPHLSSWLHGELFNEPIETEEQILASKQKAIVPINKYQNHVPTKAKAPKINETEQQTLLEREELWSGVENSLNPTVRKEYRAKLREMYKGTLGAEDANKKLDLLEAKEQANEHEHGREAGR